MKTKVLFISYCPPIPSWGGSMTFFRHFIERKDFETMVITTSDAVNDYDLPYAPIVIEEPAFWKRISKTRFLPYVYTIESLYGEHLLSKDTMSTVKQFKPDVVFTVGGSWHWTALAAKRVSDKLGIPLVGSFNDWFDYGWFPAHKSFHKAIEQKFRNFYKQVDLAVCTSEGMKEELGNHPNAHVLYPTGAVMPANAKDYRPTLSNDNAIFTIFFGGNLGDWYGKMLESLILAANKANYRLEFKIFGSNPSWSKEFDEWVKKEGVFGGRVNFDELSAEACKADLLLLPMGFGEDCALVERTSFKTKFLDYLTFNRPILVWGPEYCSAVRTAKEFDSAECVVSSDAKNCAYVIKELSEDSTRLIQLNDNAQNMYNSRFHPDKIHAGLVNKIHETIGEFNRMERK